MKKVYSATGDVQPGFPKLDSVGWYVELSDEDFEKALNEGKIFEKEGLFYSNNNLMSDSDAAQDEKGLFANPGKSIKTVTMVLFVIGCVLSLIAGIGAGVAPQAALYDYYEPSFNFLLFLLTTAVGVFASYISCLVLAAIGDIALNLRELNKKTK